MPKWLTVVETPAYLGDAKGRLSEAERETIVTALARDPYAGVVIASTHGVRKYRHGIGGRGKSGGVRVIYYVYNEDHPLLLLTVFAKNERADLSRAQANELAAFVRRLKQDMRKGQQKT